MKVYKIKDIQDISTGKTRTDGRYPLRIGRTVYEPQEWLMGTCALWYEKDQDGTELLGKYLRTSIMNEIVETKNGITIETMNSRYILEYVYDTEDPFEHHWFMQEDE